MPKLLTTDPYEDLANAIIVQAANDYREILSNYRSYDKRPSTAIALEKFFRSEWYHILTKLDGEYIIESIRKEIFGK